MSQKLVFKNDFFLIEKYQTQFKASALKYQISNQMMTCDFISFYIGYNYKAFSKATESQTSEYR